MKSTRQKTLKILIQQKGFKHKRKSDFDVTKHQIVLEKISYNGDLIRVVLDSDGDLHGSLVNVFCFCAEHKNNVLRWQTEFGFGVPPFCIMKFICSVDPSVGA